MNRRDLIRQFLLNSTSLASAVLCTHCYAPLKALSGSPRDDLAAGAKGQNADLRVSSSPLRVKAGPSLGEGSCEYAGSEEAAGQSQSFAVDPSQLPQKSHHRPRAGEQKQALSEFELYKMRNFDRTHPGDVFVRPDQQQVLKTASRKLAEVGRYVGYGHFNLLSFDEALQHARRAPRLEAFTAQEIAFFEEIFFFDAARYGFHGKKLVDKLNTVIRPHEVIKIPYSGHYLYRDVSLPVYERIIKDVGDSLILTSGIRGVVKQMHLFFVKTKSSGGNFSQASRSLAPPGFSYHAVGDFDVGKRGLGTLNFTNKFSETPEYRKLIDLGYIDIRYPFDNPFGVRFEPWHILGVERRV